jgi:2-iminoacetate synthase ThiH
MFGLKKIPLEDIFKKLDSGERIGIDDGTRLAELSGRKDMEKIFEAAAKIAAAKPKPKPLDLAAISVADGFTETAILKQIETVSSNQIYLDFEAGKAFNFEKAEHLCNSLRKSGKTVSAFTPEKILAVAESSGMKLRDVFRLLAAMNLASICGGLPRGGDAADEYFSVIMQMSKFKVRSSVQVPLAAKDAAKIEHLAKVREFEDRTHSLTYIAIRHEKKIAEMELLKTVAVVRIMMDNMDFISLADADFARPALTESVLHKAAELGVNLI